MNYAIETLKIEEYKLKETIRVVEKYSAYPEYTPLLSYYKNELDEILKAIKILEEAK